MGQPPTSNRTHIQCITPVGLVTPSQWYPGTSRSSLSQPSTINRSPSNGYVRNSRRRSCTGALWIRSLSRVIVLLLLLTASTAILVNGEMQVKVWNLEAERIVSWIGSNFLISSGIPTVSPFCKGGLRPALQPSGVRRTGGFFWYSPGFLRTYNRKIIWWRWAGSNRWPVRCERTALPTELHPHFNGFQDDCKIPQNRFLYYKHSDH